MSSTWEQFAQAAPQEQVTMALAAMRDAVAVAGTEYVYEPTAEDGEWCQYVDLDETGVPVPGCLIGNVLNRLGLSLETMLASGNRDGITTIAATPDFEWGQALSTAVVYVLGRAQSHQDQRYPWGSALAQAELAHRLVTRYTAADA